MVLNLEIFISISLNLKWWKNWGKDVIAVKNITGKIFLEATTLRALLTICQPNQETIIEADKKSIFTYVKKLFVVSEKNCL